VSKAIRSAPAVSQFRFSLASDAIPLRRELNCIQQILVAERLGEEPDCSSLSIATHRLPKRERTGAVIALTRDFHLFASGITTPFSAVLFSGRYIA
jgi:hypothetical protein